MLDVARHKARSRSIQCIISFLTIKFSKLWISTHHVIYMIHNFPQLFQLHSSSHQNNSLHSHCPRHLMPTHKLTKFSISQLTFHISSQLHDVAHPNGKESQLKAITIFSTRLGRMQTGKTSKYACTS